MKERSSDARIVDQPLVFEQLDLRSSTTQEFLRKSYKKVLDLFFGLDYATVSALLTTEYGISPFSSDAYWSYNIM